MRSVILVAILSLPLAAQQPAPAPPTPQQQLDKLQARFNDFAQLARYAADNEKIGDPAPGTQRVVFYGDSLTDNWGRKFGKFFPGKPYVNRGISGQTTPQMLVRFEQDVIHLHPAAVVILAGTNDIAGNTGPSTPEMIEDNFRAMSGIATQAGIKVILASILPAYSYPWKPGIQSVAAIREVNQWLKDYCAKEHLVYLDYYSSMSDEKGAMRPGLASDGVHPTTAGYDVMGPLAEAAIKQALAR